jgi:hypothetical protein
MKKKLSLVQTILFLFCFCYSIVSQTIPGDGQFARGELLNVKANGFRGIWYMNQPSNDEYVYKYSGGMGTFCAKHQPFAVYSKKAGKTFFCFGGTDDSKLLLHNVSYYDHKTGEIANPTTILNKNTADAHDNPVISLDDKGFIWIFSTSHGTSRPSYISRSTKPFDITNFEIVNATENVNGQDVPFTNFSYLQVWYVKGKGFFGFFTRYREGHRIIGYNTSSDGIKWNEWKMIAHIENGHYQISGENRGLISTAFDYHPAGKGVNYRTNLYYLVTHDFGKSWQTAAGEKVKLPLTEISNKALVKNYAEEKLLCYIKDINFDKKGNPVILVISSKGYESGPGNGPRKWEIFHYLGGRWENRNVTVSGNNYDMGSLYIESGKTWRIIGPTETGPQPYNPGGEVAVWVSIDSGHTWTKPVDLTQGSPMNHGFVRRPVCANPGFYAVWADGHGRKPSDSNLYFCNKSGIVYKLPQTIEAGRQTIVPQPYISVR